MNKGRTALQLQERSEREAIHEIRTKFDFELKHYFGKYRVVGMDTLSIDGKEIGCVFLTSRGRYYKTNSQFIGYSYGHSDPEESLMFINLTRRNTSKSIGHWLKSEYATFYNPSELSLTFIHELLHQLRIEDGNTWKEEDRIVALENVLRRDMDYKLLVVD